MAYPERTAAREERAAEEPARRPSLAEIFGSGILAGFVGGSMMLAAALTRSAVDGVGKWLPLQLIAGTYYGVNALLGDAGVLLVGVATHYAVAIAWGVLFSALLYRPASSTFSVVFGVLYGMGVWALMTRVILPWANETMLVRVVGLGWWWFVFHVIYGLGLGITPALRGPVKRRRRRQIPTHGAV